MRLLLSAALVVITACSTPTVVASTTTSAREPEPPRPVTTTTSPGLEVEIQGCESPPVTFSPLCEIHELLESWYFKDPIDSETLAAEAVEGLEAYTTTAKEEPPRTFFCAIPDEAFSPLCEALAERVSESGIPVGPAVEAAMSYMIDNGLDPFTYYLPPGQTGAVRPNGIVGGIGVVLDARDAAGSKCTTVAAACRLEVVVVLEDNPAWDAGLEPGDVITAVDDTPVEGMGFTEVVSKIAGNESGTVGLTVDRDGSGMSLTIERTELTVPTVEYGIPTGGVGYVRIPDFESDIPLLVTDSLAEIAADGVDTLVVDLRDNPGGYVESVLDVADEFIDDGIMMVSEAATAYEEYPAEPGGAATRQRLVVLVNEGTASAAEILAGALRDRRDAVIVGTNTFGKDAIQIPFTLRNGGEFYVAVAKWSTPDGETAGDRGLTPDRVIEWPTGSSVEDIVEIALEAAS